MDWRLAFEQNGRPDSSFYSKTSVLTTLPLIEQNMPFIKDFEAFMEEFLTIFVDIGKARMVDSNIINLLKVSWFAYDFQQLACDIDWKLNKKIV